MRIATFNVQNLRLRTDEKGPHFDGARDEIIPLTKLSAGERLADTEDRALTARLIADAAADVIALQEVFDQKTLDAFHNAYLSPLGAIYANRVCVPGNDGRRHVALMSRFPLEKVESHASLTYADLGLEPPAGAHAAERVFRRDCLTAVCGGLLILVVHFKAPADAATLGVTRTEACAVKKLIEQRFVDPAVAHWLVLGDFNVNDGYVDDLLDVLTKGFAIDLAQSLPAQERWTYFSAFHNSYARPDRILASPATAPLCRSFQVRREGMSHSALADARARFDGVGSVRPRASDHALLAVDILTG